MMITTRRSGRASGRGFLVTDFIGPELPDVLALADVVISRRRRGHGAVPDAEARLRAKIVQLKETIANKNNELARLRENVPALVRALNQLTAENESLRRQLQLPTPNVVPLRPQTQA